MHRHSISSYSRSPKHPLRSSILEGGGRDYLSRRHRREASHGFLLLSLVLGERGGREGGGEREEGEREGGGGGGREGGRKEGRGREGGREGGKERGRESNIFGIAVQQTTVPQQLITNTPVMRNSYKLQLLLERKQESIDQWH